MIEYPHFIKYSYILSVITDEAIKKESLPLSAVSTIVFSIADKVASSSYDNSAKAFIISALFVLSNASRAVIIISPQLSLL